MTIAYILDDDPQVRAMIRNVLADGGYDVHDFSTPGQMLAKLVLAPPEVIVLDLALGQSDAVDVIRRLATLEYRGKVLLISGRDETVLGEVQRIGERHQLAMLASLRKPFRAQDLTKCLMMAPNVVGASAPKQVSPKIQVNLAQALDAGWLELWYQPKIDLRSFAVCGAEALLRAKHPDYGIISPATLLPPAGDPLHVPLSEFVIARTIADWKYFADHGKAMKISVNMPVCVIQGDGFIELMRRHLPADPRFPGLIIEITEEEAIGDAALIREIATQLKLLDVWISFDDFGTAYASVAWLLELSCAELKLDRSYVAQCSSDMIKHAVCQTLVDLAHRIGSVVCAEGVENQQDLQSVIRMGCDSAQGYLFAKPMPRDVFLAQLIARGPEFYGHHHTRSLVAAGNAG